MKINFNDITAHVEAYLAERGHALGGVMHQELTRFLNYAGTRLADDAAAVESAISMLAKKGYTVVKNEFDDMVEGVGNQVAQDADNLVKATGDKAESGLTTLADKVTATGASA